MKYFKEEEFKRCSPACEISDMDFNFLHILESIREVSGVPMILCSAFRSSEYDKRKGRSGKGYHTLGRAVDIRCVDGASRAKLISASLLHNCSVGVYPTFLHIDNRAKCIVFYGK